MKKTWNNKWMSLPYFLTRLSSHFWWITSISQDGEDIDLDPNLKLRKTLSVFETGTWTETAFVLALKLASNCQPGSQEHLHQNNGSITNMNIQRELAFVRITQVAQRPLVLVPWRNVIISNSQVKSVKAKKPPSIRNGGNLIDYVSHEKVSMCASILHSWSHIIRVGMQSDRALR